MGYAKPTQARLIDQRARRRATQDLIEAHRDEFDALYRKYREAAEAEAEALGRQGCRRDQAGRVPHLRPTARRAAGRRAAASHARSAQALRDIAGPHRRRPLPLLRRLPRPRPRLPLLRCAPGSLGGSRAHRPPRGQQRTEPFAGRRTDRGDPMSDTIPAAVKAALEAGARAYAEDTYRGVRSIDGSPVVWDTLNDSDRAACAWKAQIVLTAALPVLAEFEEATR